ncbi:hypothetical protein ACFPYJ_13010 [Paenibacillus solisilvae]|uniref:DUF4282 domain-containing protein n=1 Tax=Paenibacillus solisilvae TaxID=2486751 RepID=A0ABW0VVW3_9BACL
MFSGVGVWYGLFPGIAFLLNLSLLILGVYALVMIIKLAHRGIKALDIYIDEKTNKFR